LAATITFGEDRVQVKWQSSTIMGSSLFFHESATLGKDWNAKFQASIESLRILRVLISCLSKLIFYEKAVDAAPRIAILILN